MDEFEQLENIVNSVNVCDNIQPHSSYDFDSQGALAVLWWTNVVCLPTIAGFGVACNLLNLLVLTSHEAARRMPSWHLLVSLALFDTLFLLFAACEITPASLRVTVASSALNAAYTRVALYIRMLASTFYKASILIVVAFNVERYVCVCRPLWAHRFCTSRTNRVAILLSLIVGLACSVQWPIAYDVLECYDALNAHKYAIIHMSPSSQLQTYYKVMDYVSLVLFNVAPIILLFMLNFQLISTLKSVVDQDLRRNSDSNEPMISVEPNSQRLNANVMLFAVVLLLFVCIGPQVPARILYELHDHYHTNTVLYTCISQQLVFLNASLNFCLYCLVSRRYRMLLRDSIYRIYYSVTGGEKRCGGVCGASRRRSSSCCFDSLAFGFQLRTKVTSMLLSNASPPHSTANADELAIHEKLNEHEAERGKTGCGSSKQIDYAANHFANYEPEEQLLIEDHSHQTRQIVTDSNNKVQLNCGGKRRASMPIVITIAPNPATVVMHTNTVTSNL